MTDEAPKPWERQTGETDKQFQAFAIYRDMGPARALADVGRELGKTKAAMEPWSVKNRWVERASKWDDEADRLQRERDQVERQAARMKMVDENIQLGRAFKTMVAKGLRTYDNPELPRGRKVESLTPSELARFAEVGVRIEREARGDTPERLDMQTAMKWVEQHVDLTLRYLPPEMHEAYLTDLDSLLGIGGMSAR